MGNLTECQIRDARDNSVALRDELGGENASEDLHHSQTLPSGCRSRRVAYPLPPQRGRLFGSILPLNLW